MCRYEDRDVIDLDDIDRAFLRELARDGTLSAGELGRRHGLSQTGAAAGSDPTP